MMDIGFIKSQRKELKKISIARKFVYGTVIFISLLLFMITIVLLYLGVTSSGLAVLAAHTYLMIYGMSTIAGGFLAFLVKRDYNKKMNNK